MVNWKKTIINTEVTTAEIFAGDVLNYVVQYHSGVDLAAGDPLGSANIATETTYQNERLKLYDAGGNNTITFSVPEYLENKTISFSSTMTTSDTIALLNSPQILANKVIDGATNSISINATTNTITDTGTALGDIMASNGAKFVRRPRGSSLQVLRTNTGGTDIEWASLDSERVGKSTASGNANNTVFTIAHGLGSNPTYCFVNCSSLTETFTYTTDATNISIAFATPPPTGTSNIVIYWRVVA